MMSMIDVDDPTRAKLQALRLSTFADVFFELLNDGSYADALPEAIFFDAVDKAAEQRRQRNIATAISQAKFRYPDATIAELINAKERGINERQLKRIAATPWREEPGKFISWHKLVPGKPILRVLLVWQRVRRVIQWRIPGWTSWLIDWRSTRRRIKNMWI